jgi:hypothetical protein
VGPGSGLDDVERKNSCPDRGSNSDPSAVQPAARRNKTQTQKLMKNSVLCAVASTVRIE